MKILFVHDICGLSGGAEQVVLDLARGLRARGHTCHLAYGRHGRDPVAFAESFHRASRCHELDDGVASADGESFDEIFRQGQPETVFFHNVPRLPNLQCLDRRIRTVRMVHDVRLVCPTGLGYFRHGRCSCHHPITWRCWVDLGFCVKTGPGLGSIRYRSISRRLDEIRRNQRLDRIVTVSQYMKQRLEANGFDPMRIDVAAPALDCENHPVVPVPESPEILFVGSLLRGKGVDLLFRALHKVRVPFHLSIVGTGKSMRTLERLSQQLGLQQRIVFHGWVPASQLVDHYDRARVVVIPTRAPESFCLIGPEAMRRGRPVVAFDVGGISDWLEHEHTGLLVPEQDIDAFGRALERLLTDTAYAQRLGANAAVRASERFSNSDFIDRVEAILNPQSPVSHGPQGR